MQADLFRLYFLRHEGGVYVDADESCRAPLTPLLAALAHTEIIVVRSADPMPYVHNFFFVARPGAALLHLALEEMEPRLDREEKPSIWDTTGPGCITRSLARALLDRPETPGLVASALSEEHYRLFVRNHGELAYKSTREGSWTSA